MSRFMLTTELLDALERARVPRDARLLFVEAVAYAAANLTDGELRVRLSKITDADDPLELAQQLVDSGMWVDLGDGFQIVDYVDMQDGWSASRILEARENTRFRKERNRRHLAGDHSKCTRGNYCPQGALEPVTRDRKRDKTRDKTRDATGIGQDWTGRDVKDSPKTKAGTSSSSAPERSAAQEPSQESHIYVGHQGRCQVCSKEPGGTDHTLPDYLPDEFLRIARTAAIHGFSTTVRAAVPASRHSAITFEKRDASAITLVDEGYELEFITSVVPLTAALRGSDVAAQCTEELSALPGVTETSVLPGNGVLELWVRMTPTGSPSDLNPALSGFLEIVAELTEAD